MLEQAPRRPAGGPRLPFAPMRFPLLAPLLVAAAAGSASAQLPYLTVPSGGLRIELGGAFLPVTQEFADGDLRRLGDPLAGSSLFGSSLGPRLTELLGQPAEGGSGGGVTAEVMQQRGVGTIGLGVGVTSRLTVGVRIPIVSARSEWAITPDEGGATVGLNPALRGNQASQLFADQFESALGALRTRRDAGDYDADPQLRALADQLLTEAPVWRARFVSLVLNPGTAEQVLPVTASADGSALLEQATQFRDQLTGPLAIAGFTSLPALPAEAVTGEEIGALLTDAGAFGLVAPDEIPLVTLGDVEFEANWLLFARADSAARRWSGAWVQGGVTLPTGTPPRADRLRDPGTGDGQMDVSVGATAEFGAGRLGLRGSVAYRHQLAGERETRITTRDAFLVPASRTELLQWDPGNELTLTAQPFYRIADRLALTGSLTWWRRGDDAWTRSDGTTDPDVAAMGDGSAASAVMIGAGVAYAHHGAHVDGVQRRPVEAGLSLERTVASGSGLVPRPLTTRLWFRVYGRLW